jgi:hypothetical protein
MNDEILKTNEPDNINNFDNIVISKIKEIQELPLQVVVDFLNSSGSLFKYDLAKRLNVNDSDSKISD